MIEAFVALALAVPPPRAPNPAVPPMPVATAPVPTRAQLLKLLDEIAGEADAIAALMQPARFNVPTRDQT